MNKFGIFGNLTKTLSTSSAGTGSMNQGESRSVGLSRGNGDLMGRSVDGEELKGIAWKFLCSPYAGDLYWNLSLEQRIDAFLRHEQRCDIIKDGAAHRDLVHEVMNNVALARSCGLLKMYRH